MAMATGMATGMVMKSKARLVTSLSGLALLGAAPAALSQQQQQQPLGAAAGAFSATSTTNMAQNLPDGLGQSTNQGQAWVIHPRITLTETLTDNANVNGGTATKRSDLITELAPGVRIDARTARFRGYFDYSLRGILYARESGFNQTQNALNTRATLEAVDNWLFVDFSGLISQQAISAFGTQSPSNTTINNNTTETANFKISPYVRGRIGTAVDYMLRYSASTTQSDASTASDSNLSEWTGQLRGSTMFHNLAWTVDASQQRTDYSRGRTTDADRLRGMLTYLIDPQFRASVSVGQESNNYASLNQETHETFGYGFDWTPTDRTQLSVFKERRFFGDGHTISFSHRFPRSSIRYTDTRDVSVLPNQFSTVGLGSVYDLYFQLFSNLQPFAEMTGPAKDAAVANAVNAFLAQSGVSPNTQVTSSFLTSRATVQRLQQLTLALTGVRNTLTLLATRSENQSILASSSLVDDFSQSSQIRQQGFSLTFSHKLTATSNLNATASHQQSIGSGGTTTNSRANSTTYQVNLTTRLGSKTNGSLSFRRSEFDNATNPYKENALIGMISVVY